MSGHADFSWNQFFLPVTKDHERILSDGQTAQNRLNAGKHGFGIRTEEEQARCFISLPETAKTVVACGGADLADDGVEIEAGVRATTT